MLIGLLGNKFPQFLFVFKSLFLLHFFFFNPHLRTFLFFTALRSRGREREKHYWLPLFTPRLGILCVQTRACTHSCLHPEHRLNPQPRYVTTRNQICNPSVTVRWGFNQLSYPGQDSPSHLQDNFVGDRILGWCLFLCQCFKYFTPLCSCLHCFWGRVLVIFIFVPSRGQTPLPHDFFKDFLCIFDFSIIYNDIPRYYLLVFFLFDTCLTLLDLCFSVWH